MKNTVEKFIRYFNMHPVAGAAAPGRLEVLGNHTDYNEGIVLSCAVGQTTRFVAAPVPGSRCHVHDFRSDKDMVFDLADMDNPPHRDGRCYIVGMMKEMRKRGCEFTCGFNAALDSDVPLSAGMSSSAALEISAGLALGKVYGFDLDKAEWARAGQGVENDFLGLKSGLLDQFSSLFGAADSMIVSDFRTVEVIDTIPVPPGYCFVVINSMKKHNLVDSAYNVRRENCESAARKLAEVYENVKTLRDVTPEMLEEAAGKLDQLELLRARHVVNECFRVLEAGMLLADGQLEAFGELLRESHLSSKNNFENSTPELDYLVELSSSIPGALGARLSGGGFGGISIHLVKSDEAETYAQKVCTAYKLRTGIEAQYFVCAIGSGAEVFEL